MARIAGVDLPKEKRVEIGLTYIFGIGRTTAKKILKQTEIAGDIRVEKLSAAQVNMLRQVIERDLKVEGELRQEISMNIKRLKDIGCHRGIRHRKRLPVRGQKTRTNARTHKGQRPGIGIKKKAKKA
ncbi:MAG: 30S ribosomal protein S13 [Candidatus Coatesbacteria bacterium]|nr:30S ribosomal protein S13 [Candidatus Coatesbacteria bacterium]